MILGRYAQQIRLNSKPHAQVAGTMRHGYSKQACAILISVGEINFASELFHKADILKNVQQVSEHHRPRE